MPPSKDFKRLIRGRMQKTGESYTAARAVLLSRPPRRLAAPALPAEPATSASSEPMPDYQRLAGMSDEAIKKNTGCTWERWVFALDHVQAHTWSHREIAEYVHEKYKVPDWWTQTVTVGYERIKGLRDIGQRRGGSYEATRSKTFAVPVSRLYRAWTDTRVRRKWLPGIRLTIRKATPDKSVRISWDDGTSVEVWLIDKGDKKSTAQVAHRKLPRKTAADARKEYWGERLDALAQLLSPRG